MHWDKFSMDFLKSLFFSKQKSHNSACFCLWPNFYGGRHVCCDVTIIWAYWCTWDLFYTMAIWIYFCSLFTDWKSINNFFNYDHFLVTFRTALVHAAVLHIIKWPNRPWASWGHPARHSSIDTSSRTKKLCVIVIVTRHWRGISLYVFQSNKTYTVQTNV